MGKNSMNKKNVQQQKMRWLMDSYSFVMMKVYERKKLQFKPNCKHVCFIGGKFSRIFLCKQIFRTLCFRRHSTFLMVLSIKELRNPVSALTANTRRRCFDVDSTSGRQIDVETLCAYWA